MGSSLKNFVLYNIGWFAAVYFAAQGQAWIADCAIALVVGAHLLSVPVWKKEALLLAIAGLIGVLWETTLVWSGVLSYPASPGLGILAPSWIVAMWVLFATTINVSLSWVKRHWWLASLFGALGGPLAFIAGKALGAVEFGDPVMTPLVIGAGWAVLLPLLCRIADHINASPIIEPEQESERSRQVDNNHRFSIFHQAMLLKGSKSLNK